MKFAIIDLIWTTTAIALLFALLRQGDIGFFLAFVLLNLMQILMPFVVMFATILFADQRGQTLDISTLAGWRSIKRVWFLSIVCTIIVWTLLLLAPIR